MLLKLYMCSIFRDNNLYHIPRACWGQLLRVTCLTPKPNTIFRFSEMLYLLISVIKDNVNSFLDTIVLSIFRFKSFVMSSLKGLIDHCVSLMLRL